MKRRTFLAALAVLPALTVLGGSALRLPRREETEVPKAFGVGDSCQRFSNTLSTSADLSEKALEDMLRQLRDNVALSSFSVRPTKLIVHPKMIERARYVLTHRPGLFERLWWMLVPAP